MGFLSLWSERTEPMRQRIQRERNRSLISDHRRSSPSAQADSQAISEPSTGTMSTADVGRRPTRLLRSSQIYYRRLFPFNGASPLVTTTGEGFAGLRSADRSPQRRFTLAHLRLQLICGPLISPSHSSSSTGDDGKYAYAPFEATAGSAPFG